jgi:hypothetical protein
MVLSISVPMLHPCTESTLGLQMLIKHHRAVQSFLASQHAQAPPTHIKMVSLCEIAETHLADQLLRLVRARAPELVGQRPHLVDFQLHLDTVKSSQLSCVVFETRPCVA